MNEALGNLVAPSKISTTLIVVRHGETSWNEVGRLQGQLDIPLNDTGHRQAVATGTYIAARWGVSVSEIVSSDLLRAAATAQAIAAALGSHHTVTIDAGLRETNLGVWQGSTWEFVSHEFRDEVHQWRTNPDAAMQGGESTRQRLHRVAQALHMAALRNVGGVVVVVAHGGVIDDVARLACRVPFGESTRRRKVNAGVTVIRAEIPTHVANAVTSLPIDTAARREALSALVASAMPAADAVKPDSAHAALGLQWHLEHWGIDDHLKAAGSGAEADAVSGDFGAHAAVQPS